MRFEILRQARKLFAGPSRYRPLAKVVRRLDNAIHRTNRIVIYLVDSVIHLLNNPRLRSLGVALSPLAGHNYFYVCITLFWCLCVLGGARK